MCARKLSESFPMGMMEYRHNSGPCYKFQFIGVSRLHRATIVWYGPRYLIYNTKSLLLRIYADGPHCMNPSPESLNESGYTTRVFFTIICFSQSWHYHLWCFNHTLSWQVVISQMLSLWRRLQKLASLITHGSSTPRVPVQCLRSLREGEEFVSAFRNPKTSSWKCELL